jgi:hypothetical protein
MLVASIRVARVSRESTPWYRGTHGAPGRRQSGNMRTVGDELSRVYDAARQADAGFAGAMARGRPHRFSKSERAPYPRQRGTDAFVCQPAIPEPDPWPRMRIGTVVLSDSGGTARVGQFRASAANPRLLAVLRSDNITTMKLRETLTTLGLFLVRKIPPGYYLGRIIWLFIALSSMRVDRTYALPIQIVGGCIVVCETTGRLCDAGFSRYWACLILPTLAAHWFFPALFPGAWPFGIVLQLADAVRTRNPYQIGLVAALLAFPLALGLIPTRRLSVGPQSNQPEGAA